VANARYNGNVPDTTFNHVVSILLAKKVGAEYVEANPANRGIQ